MIRTFLILALCAISFAASAEYSDLYVVPVAGHAPGAFGTAWRSDVVLHNIQESPVTVEIVLVESGAAPSAAPVAVTTIDLMPRETRTLTDVAATLGRNVVGALIAGADAPFAITSRTWAEVAGGRTLGQSVTPVAIGSAADAFNSVAVLPSLATNSEQRSNSGVFVAASRAPLVVEITLQSESGAVRGSEVIVLDEPGFIHRQLSLSPADERVTAVVRIVEGEGIAVPYASVVDNGSAEALFVSGQPISVGFTAARDFLTSIVSR